MPSGSGLYPRWIGDKTETNVSWNGIASKVVSHNDLPGGGWARQSVSTPGFGAFTRGKNKIFQPHELPMNGFNFSNEVYSYPVTSTNLKRVYKNGQGFDLQTVSGLFDVGLRIPARGSGAAIDAQAVAKLLSKAKSQSTNLAVALAESHQTVNLFVNTAKRITAAGLAVKQGKFALAAASLGLAVKKQRLSRMKSTNSLAQNWLELQYGWLPLLSDLYGSAEALANYRFRPARFKLTSSAHQEYDENYTTDEFRDVLVDVLTYSHTVKYVVYFQEDKAVQTPTSLGLTNPFSVAWELVPWSFVVDWFLPIGSYLDSLDATNGLVFIKGCKTEFWRGNSTRSVTGKAGVDNGSTVDTFYCNYEASLKKTYCNRSVLHDWPVPVLPQFKNPLTGKHVANAMALLATTFGHKSAR